MRSWLFTSKQPLFFTNVPHTSFTGMKYRQVVSQPGKLDCRGLLGLWPQVPLVTPISSPCSLSRVRLQIHQPLQGQLSPAKLGGGRVISDHDWILWYWQMPTAEEQGVTVTKLLQGDLFSLTSDPGHTRKTTWNPEKLKYAEYCFVR